MRPTGKLHLGHYFGVLVNYLELQKSQDCYFMVADLHALTTGDISKANLAQNTQDMLLDWLAVGVDPERATIFVQSSVPQHAELFAILSMVTSVGWLERNPTYKEMRQQLGDKNTNSLGLFAYPVLQAVDVCIYKGTHVPVGEDQKPHLEMGRELVRRFNSTFKKAVFPEFEALLTPSSKLPGLDGRKMSKSYGNTLDLSEDPAQIRKRVKTMLTDVERPRREMPGHPENCTVFSYHHLFTPPARVEAIARECRAAELSCGDDKIALAEQIIAWQAPILKKRKELENNLDYVKEIVTKGNQKAQTVAEQTMKEVREIVGYFRSSV